MDVTGLMLLPEDTEIGITAAWEKVGVLGTEKIPVTGSCAVTSYAIILHTSWKIVSIFLLLEGFCLLCHLLIPSLPCFQSSHTVASPPHRYLFTEGIEKGMKLW
jgi:hypothetical protein